MAVCSTITCSSCEKKKGVSHQSGSAPPKICSECRDKNAAEERQRALDEVAALPIEERLRLVEAFMYDHKRLYHPGSQALF